MHFYNYQLSLILDHIYLHILKCCHNFHGHQIPNNNFYHHLDFAEPGNTGSDLVVKGIVYNEMKGAYSDLDGIIDQESSAGICPDNAYGLDSGGKPEAIPSLTYEDFVAFYKTYYHPSNSYIFLYGNLPADKQLEFLDRTCLGAYDRIQVDSGILPQPRWSEPNVRWTTE